MCLWAYAKRGNFCICDILIGVVGVFAGGSTIIMRWEPIEKPNLKLG